IPTHRRKLPTLPLATLFPYTTLFRSRRHRQSRCFGDVLDAHHARVHLLRPSSVFVWAGPKSHGPYIVETITRWETITSCMGNTRSEEHTSELQSRFDLVCRLLLEKKN